MVVRCTKLNFSSYLLLCLFMSVSFGLFLGALIFLLSLFGVQASTNFLFIEFQGIAAGVTSLLIVPFIMSLMGLFYALLSYFPFRLLLNLFKGISLKGQYTIDTIRK